MSSRIDAISKNLPLDSPLTYDDILDIFGSDLFDNDVWLKIDYIELHQTEFNSSELIDIYDNH